MRRRGSILSRPGVAAVERRRHLDGADQLGARPAIDDRPARSVTQDVSCGSPSWCFATAAGFIPVRSGYRSVPAIVPVSADGVPGPVQLLTTQAGNAHGVSCPAGTDVCTVVGSVAAGEAHGLVVETRGGSPTAVTHWTNANFFTSVSCVTGESCGIVGGNNFNGVFAWKGPTPP